MRKRNLISAVVLLMVSIAYGFLTANLPTRAIENSTQPSFFPWVIAVCLFILSFTLLVQGVLALGNTRTPAPITIPSWKSGLGLISAIAYLIVLPELGFVLANIFIFAILMWLYGERRPVRLAAGSILIPLAIFLIFRELFQIRLPSGVLEGFI